MSGPQYSTISKGSDSVPQAKKLLLINQCQEQDFEVVTLRDDDILGTNYSLGTSAADPIHLPHNLSKYQVKNSTYVKPTLHHLDPPSPDHHLSTSHHLHTTQPLSSLANHPLPWLSDLRQHRLDNPSVSVSLVVDAASATTEHAVPKCTLNKRDMTGMFEMSSPRGGKKEGDSVVSRNLVVGRAGSMPEGGAAKGKERSCKVM